MNRKKRLRILLGQWRSKTSYACHRDGEFGEGKCEPTPFAD